MDSRFKFENRNGSLNISYPPLFRQQQHHHYSNGNTATRGTRGLGRPMYTIGSPSHSALSGAQLFMNTPSVGTSTQFQFIPARNFTTTQSLSSSSLPTATINMGNFSSSAYLPIFQSIKGFLTNLIKPKVSTTIVDQNHPQNNIKTAINHMDTTAASVPLREFNSAPNIYNTEMFHQDKLINGSGGGGVGFEGDHKNIIDLNDVSIINKLSQSTKSFSDYDLPKHCYGANSIDRRNFNDIYNDTKEEEVPAKLTPLIEPIVEPKLTKETTENQQTETIPIESAMDSLQITQRNLTKRRNRKRNNRMSKLKQRTDSVMPKLCKKFSKNAKEKHRHEIAQDIHDDELEDGNCDVVSDTEDASHTLVAESPKKCLAPAEIFSNEDFPAIAQGSPKKCKNLVWNILFNDRKIDPLLDSCRKRVPSECQSEDSFVVFESSDDDESPNNSLASSLESIPSSSCSSALLCDRIRNVLKSQPTPAAPTLQPTPPKYVRQRQLSECSDDFICFEYDKNDEDQHRYDETEEEHYTYATSSSDSDDSDDEEDCVDDDSADDEVDEKASLGTNKSESGFEERKVRFNLKPEVHVIRAWSFAYHQARKSIWEQIGRDRVRFHDRTKRLESILNPVMDKAHREKMYTERFQ